MKNVFLIFLAMVGIRLAAQSDPQATPETKGLLQNLLELQNRGIMFGHQDDLAYGNGWYNEPGRSDIKDVCGDYPGICGWELGHLELGNPYSLDSVYFSNIRKGIISFDKQGRMEVDLLCAEARVAVELDGPQHLSDLDAYRRDRRKDALLQENGYFVLRFLAEDVGKHLDHVLDAILRALVRRKGGSDHSSSFAS
jgi:very-short-patch-repair endonuclease